MFYNSRSTNITCYRDCPYMKNGKCNILTKYSSDLDIKCNFETLCDAIEVITKNFTIYDKEKVIDLLK